MVETKQKNKTAVAVVITVAALAVACAVIFAALFISNKMRLEKAIADLDIEDENSVIALMTLDGDNPETVMTVIDAYCDGERYTDAARLLLYYIQYLYREDSDALHKLTDCYKKSGADDDALRQLITPLFRLSDFETVTQSGDTAYGVSDGIYTTFLGGTAKAKISSVIPLSVAACPSGVYALDSSDNRLKLIYRDGSCVETVHDARMTEFVIFESYLYYIDINGIPHGPNEVDVDEGLVALNLRVDGENVVCTLYDEDYNEIKDISLSGGRFS